MTLELLLKWVNDSELSIEEIADAINRKVNYLRNVFCGAAPISAPLKAALKAAYPDDLELTRILDGCPHCWDGLQGDSGDGFNEPIHCMKCAQGIRLEMTRIRAKIGAFTESGDWLTRFFNLQDKHWVSKYHKAARKELREEHERLTNKLAQLEAAK